VKALTLWRPWPWAIFHAPKVVSKPIENRSWPPPDWILGQRIAVHAGMMIDDAATELEIVSRCGLVVTDERPVHFYDLGVIGVATVKNFFRSREEVEAALGPAAAVWWIGEYAWHLTDRVALAKPVPCKPVPCKGFQKLWNLPAEVERQVLEQLR
jgi:hypothetical protein